MAHLLDTCTEPSIDVEDLVVRKKNMFCQENPDELTTISIIRVYNYRWKYNVWQVVRIVGAEWGHYLAWIKVLFPPKVNFEWAFPSQFFFAFVV